MNNCTCPKKPLRIESLESGDIAKLWVELTEAAKTDTEARTFLAMFEPWAKVRLDRPLS